jgi:hypothetical protein
MQRYYGAEPSRKYQENNSCCGLIRGVFVWETGHLPPAQSPWVYLMVLNPERYLSFDLPKQKLLPCICRNILNDPGPHVS